MPPLTFYLQFVCTLLYLAVWGFFYGSNLSAISRTKGKAAWRAPVVGSDELPGPSAKPQVTCHGQAAWAHDECQ